MKEIDINDFLEQNADYIEISFSLYAYNEDKYNSDDKKMLTMAFARRLLNGFDFFREKREYERVIKEEQN